MTDQLPGWLSAMAPQLAEIDPGFMGALGALMGLANRPDDPLEGRTRILIAMALDLAGGAELGVASMAGAARGNGATDVHIADVVEVCAAAAALQRTAVGGAAFGGSMPAVQEQLGALDPDFLAAAERIVSVAFADKPDGLPVKDKHLVRLALDAAFGNEERVRYGADRCRKSGATDGEILSVLKMVFVNATLQRLAGCDAAY